MKRLISTLLPAFFSVLVAAALVGVRPMCVFFDSINLKCPPP